MRDSGSGLLLSRHDTEGWKKAYETAQNPSTREAWAAKGRTHVEGKFTLGVQANALQRLLDDCMNNA
jgi:hypothetical protein